MKDIKYSTMRARYNRYCKVVDFFSWYGLAFLFVCFPAAIGGGMFEAGIHNVFSISCVVLTILLFIYMIIGGCIMVIKFLLKNLLNINLMKIQKRQFAKIRNG